MFTKACTQMSVTALFIIVKEWEKNPTVHQNKQNVVYPHKGFPGGSMVRTRLSIQEMQETWVQPFGWGDPLEEDTATHSSILA